MTKRKSLAVVVGMAGVVASCAASPAYADIDELFCLAQSIYHEARAEGPYGMLAVAHVTLNRVDSESFPDTICGVVYQAKQFSWTHDEKSDLPDMSDIIERGAWLDSISIARQFVEQPEVMKTVDITDGSLYYHSKDVSPDWADAFDVSAKWGNHIFYTEEDTEEE